MKPNLNRGARECNAGSSVTRPPAVCTLLRLLCTSHGQDMVEYALILCFIALAGAAAMIGMSGGIDTLWSIANSRLAAASN